MLWQKIKRKIILKLFLYELNKNNKSVSEGVDLSDIPQLSNSQEKFKALVENINDVMWEADFNFRCTYVTPNVFNHIGYKQEEVIGKTPYSFMSKKEAKRVFEVILESIESGQGVKNFQSILLNKDGHPVITETSTTLIFDSNGELKGFRGIDRDITDRKKEKDLSDALNDISAAINSTLEFEEIMHRVVMESIKAIGCESCLIIMQEDSGWLIKHHSGLPQELDNLYITNDALKHDGIKLSKMEPIAIRDAADDKIIDKGLAEKLNLRSVLISPLAVKGKSDGYILFNYYSNPTTFNDAEIDFAKKLGYSVSLAMENAQLYEAEHKIADTLQKSLLTVPKKIEGIEYSNIYVSSTETALVGGDFYDIFELENDKVGILEGDISGKGLEAAALTSIVKNAIKTLAYDGNDPATVIAKTNNLLIKTTSPNMFATIFFGILDKMTNTLTFCNAGHTPAILKNNVSNITTFPANSPCIGVLEEPKYENDIIKTKKGDILIVYTDGVTEARQNKKFSVRRDYLK